MKRFLILVFTVFAPLTGQLAPVVRWAAFEHNLYFAGCDS
jgi:hypothetical protein